MERIKQTPEKFQSVEVTRQPLEHYPPRARVTDVPQTTFPARVWRTTAGLGANIWAWILANQAALAASVGTVITLRVALGIVGLLATSFISENRIALVRHPSTNVFLDMWARWDGIRYLTIAQFGYFPHDDNLAFFPLYPALIRAFTPLLNGDMVLAGLVVATLAFVAALFYLYKLVEFEFDREVAERTVLYISIAPMAFFFLSLYTEPLFLLLSVAAIYHARRSQWAPAIILGALAVLTRPVGVLLLIPLGYEALTQWRAHKPDASLGLFGLAALPAALLGWMFNLYQLTGDWLAFVHAQAGNTWHRSSALPWQTLSAAVQRLEQHLPAFQRGQYSVDMASALILLLAAVVAFRYLPRVYSLYLAASVVFLLTSRSDQQVLFSMPRFAMVLFPMFILFALAGRNRQVHRFIVISSLALLGMYTALFVRWYWIA